MSNSDRLSCQGTVHSTGRARGFRCGIPPDPSVWRHGNQFASHARGGGAGVELQPDRRAGLLGSRGLLSQRRVHHSSQPRRSARTQPTHRGRPDHRPSSRSATHRRLSRGVNDHRCGCVDCGEAKSSSGGEEHSGGRHPPLLCIRLSSRRWRAGSGTGNAADKRANRRRRPVDRGSKVPIPAAASSFLRALFCAGSLSHPPSRIASPCQSVTCTATSSMPLLCWSASDRRSMLRTPRRIDGPQSRSCITRRRPLFVLRCSPHHTHTTNPTPLFYPHFPHATRTSKASVCVVHPRCRVPLHRPPPPPPKLRAARSQRTHNAEKNTRDTQGGSSHPPRIS